MLQYRVDAVVQFLSNIHMRINISFSVCVCVFFNFSLFYHTLYLNYIGFFIHEAHPIPYVTTPALHYSDFGWPISGLIVIVLQHLYGTTTAAHKR